MPYRRSKSFNAATCGSDPQCQVPRAGGQRRSAAAWSWLLAIIELGELGLHGLGGGGGIRTISASDPSIERILQEPWAGPKEVQNLMVEIARDQLGGSFLGPGLLLFEPGLALLG